MSAMLAGPPREVVGAFTSAAITALQELTSIEAFSESIPSAMEAAPHGQVVSAAIRLERTLPGTMYLVLTADAASQLADRYLPWGTRLTADLVDDVIGEFANVIAGQAKTILKASPYHFTMSTPVVARAASLAQLPMAMDARLATTLASELGRILILVDLPPCPNA